MTNPVQWPIPFGNYLLDGPIAHGGMARLYRARLRGVSGFEKPLAVKQMRPELAQDPRFVKLFVEEARALVRLGHPHIVTVYELGIVEGTYFLAMEHVEGASLAEILEDGPLSPEIVAHVGAQAADALAHAHGRHGLVHRDMTPRNVLVDLSGYVRVVDFGIASYAGEGGGLGLGSPGYMAPEQLLGEPAGPEVDVFALGATLYYAAVGRHAFYEADAARVREKVLGGALPELGALPPALAALLAGCFARDPTTRPTAAALAAALRGYVASVHPEGVATTLAARVERAYTRAAADLAATPTSAPIATDREPTIRTLATSTVLRDALVGSPVTQPMTVAAAPNARSTRTRPRGYIVALTSFVVVVALGVAVERARAPSPAPTVGVIAPVRTAGPDAGAGVEPVADAGATDASALATRDAALAQDAGPSARDAGTGAARPAAGTLTVAATPWAEVRVDGRALGRTPRRGLSLPPGTHTIELACPPLGRSARARFRVESGKETRVVADLTTTPPSVRVR